MRRGVVVGLGCVLLTGVMGARARAGHELSNDELRVEIARNRALAAYVARNGMPDLAETRFLSDEPPWDEHEVTLYYLDRRKEIGFARAFLLGRPDVQIARYQRPLTDEEAAGLAERARRRSEGDGGGARTASDRALRPDERAENAAQRAEAAAERVELAAMAAERAAERTEAIVAKMEKAAPKAPSRGARRKTTAALSRR
jgi:hypothetical protein